jgi:hypothetical protein
MSVVVKRVGYVMVHVPDFVRYGSKPVRDIEDDGTILEKVNNSVRSYEDAVSYAPNQVFIGNMHPDDLKKVQKPWYRNLLQDANRPEREVRGDLSRRRILCLVEDLRRFQFDLARTGIYKSHQGEDRIRPLHE